MGKSLHSSISKALLAGLALAAPYASAVCVSPLFTPTECDFKDEDTQVFAITEGYMKKMDEKVKQYFTNAQQHYLQIKAGTKLSGLDRNSTDGLQFTIGAGAAMITSATAATTSYRAADPFQLRLIQFAQHYAVCYALYQEGCQETITPQAIRDVQAAIAAGEDLFNTDTVIGYVMGDSLDDFNAMRGSIDNIDSIVHSLAPQEIAARIEQRMPTFEALLDVDAFGMPVSEFNREEHEAGFMGRARSAGNTLRDVMASTNTMARRMTEADPTVPGSMSDIAQGQFYASSVENELGRQQALENEALQRSLIGDQWTSISEIMSQKTMLFGSQYMEEMGQTNYSDAATTNALAPLPGVANSDGRNNAGIAP